MCVVCSPYPQKGLLRSKGHPTEYWLEEGTAKYSSGLSYLGAPCASMNSDVASYLIIPQATYMHSLIKTPTVVGIDGYAHEVKNTNLGRSTLKVSCFSPNTNIKLSWHHSKSNKRLVYKVGLKIVLVNSVEKLFKAVQMNTSSRS